MNASKTDCNSEEHTLVYVKRELSRELTISVSDRIRHGRTRKLKSVRKSVPEIVGWRLTVFYVGRPRRRGGNKGRMEKFTTARTTPIESRTFASLMEI